MLVLISYSHGRARALLSHRAGGPPLSSLTMEPLDRLLDSLSSALDGHAVGSCVCGCTSSPLVSSSELSDVRSALREWEQELKQMQLQAAANAEDKTMHAGTTQQKVKVCEYHEKMFHLRKRSDQSIRRAGAM